MLRRVPPYSSAISRSLRFVSIDEALCYISAMGSTNGNNTVSSSSGSGNGGGAKKSGSSSHGGRYKKRAGRGRSDDDYYYEEEEEEEEEDEDGDEQDEEEDELWCTRCLDDDRITLCAFCGCKVVCGLKHSALYAVLCLTACLWWFETQCAICYAVTDHLFVQHRAATASSTRTCSSSATTASRKYTHTASDHSLWTVCLTPILGIAVAGAPSWLPAITRMIEMEAGRSAAASVVLRRERRRWAALWSQSALILQTAGADLRGWRCSSRASTTGAPLTTDR